MKQIGRQWLGRHLASRGLRAGTVLVAAGSSALLGGCINVTAPDKPIVIELNVNIRQEVIYKLAADAAKTIDDNKDIF
ncbi:YnbE family lipoprotein [Novosphingobium sp. 9]|uniref:YnbE family lipoprotein n=1 Tax=Novosphingobium sp. 9 TaxID=2025349 RepID=UPI0021B643FD|nr:YnbE family lipoprotein [Novosphingobium sp. 9]